MYFQSSGSKIKGFLMIANFIIIYIDLGRVVQSVLSLTSSLWVISLTVLEYSIYNILIFFAEKM